MFRAPLCPSSEAREYYKVIQYYAARKPDTTLSSTQYRQLVNQAPKTTGGNQLYNALELLMIGIMVPETC
jgi:hypothetical protein